MAMKRVYLWTIVSGCVIGLGVGLGLRMFKAQANAQLNPDRAAAIDPSDPKYKEVMCGPASLSVALGRIGVNRLPVDVASACKVTAAGVALTDLERDANATGLVNARPGRLSWDELSRLDGVAVLFVNGNHYIAVDPRQAADGDVEAGKLRVYEPDRPAQWWAREQLETIWRGEALVLTRQPARVDEAQGGPCIDWDECFVDQGVLRNTRHAHYRFSFRNAGTSELVIGEIQRSCGCSKHTVSQERLAPGQSAIIEAEVNLQGTEGYFHHYVTVQTNDAINPMSVLTMAGGVPRARVVSSDWIRLEDLPQGGTASKKFYVADPGFNGAKIREARFVPRGASGLEKHLSCSISHDLLGDDAKRASSSVFRATPRDYGVLLAFEASTACPAGPFQGEVKLVLEADGVVTTHKVDIEGTIVHDVHPVPRVALITVDREGSGSATIGLRSHSGKEVAVVKTWSNNPNSMKITPRIAEVGKKEYLITAHEADVMPGAAPLQRAAFFELADGSVASVPVAVFRPPQ
jgi:hypothetical protein